MSRFAGRPSFHGQRSFAIHRNAGGTAARRAALNANRGAAFSRNSSAAAFSRNRSATVRTNAVRNALNSRAVAGALHNRAALRNPNARAQIVASAATAGWLRGRGERNGWWRHGNGGYGWVGPLFWPFAYYDIYDYTLWGYGYDPLFWDYGYSDIYAGLFAPYGYDDLLGYLPPIAAGGAAGGRASSARVARSDQSSQDQQDQLAQMCGDDSRDIAGLPIDRIQQALQLNEEQRAALDDLANASAKAAQEIKAACPTQIALTAPNRLSAMQQRIEAMIVAVETVQPALQKFYDLLNDEQRARLNALAQDQRGRKATRNARGSPLTQNCGVAQPGVTEWPAAEIEARVHPTEEQRASLAAFQEATSKAADMLKASCQPTEAITPPARLEAIGNRLETMLQAIKIVRAALDDFYGKLSDEQKAQFESIGHRRPALSSQPTATRTHSRRHRAGVDGFIRHFIAMVR
jgi:LTXXQ motif family protein